MALNGTSSSLSSLQWERLASGLPQAIVVCEPAGKVTYANAAASQLGLVKGDRLVRETLREIAQLVFRDGKERTTELSIEASSNEMQLQLHASRLDNGLVAFSACDHSSQHAYSALQTQLIANISHELKTPLGAIELLAETLENAAEDPEAVRYFASRLTAESQRLRSLVLQVIEIQRQEQNQQVPIENVDCAAAIREALSITRGIAQSKRTHIAVFIEGQRYELGERPTNTVPQIMAQVAYKPLVSACKNIIENAIIYSPEASEVAIEIRTRSEKKPKERLNATYNKRAKNCVIIRIIDHGIGIAKHDQQHVFERFYRADASRARSISNTHGSGLGLAIAKRAVEQCNGRLTLWSQPHVGTTVTIELNAGCESETH